MKEATHTKYNHSMRRLGLAFIAPQGPSPQMESDRLGKRWERETANGMAGSVSSSSKEGVGRITGP